MLEGFVTLGRAELLFSFCAVAALMAALGWAVGQIVMIIKRPAALAPKPCIRLHCDDGPQMAKWLAARDFRLVTAEVLAEMEADLARYRNRPTEFKMQSGPLTLTPEQERNLLDAIEEYQGKHRAH